MSEGRGINYRALAEFRYEIRRFLNFSETAARASGIEPHQHQALLAIRGIAPEAKATVGWLADQLHVQHHSAVELIDRLESKRLVRRSRRQTDRREVLLQLTSRGEKLLQALSAHHRAELRTTGPRLLKTLRAAIDRTEESVGLRKALSRQPRIAEAAKRYRQKN
jgi:DNA-binding MarR family transcriptional regulator